MTINTYREQDLVRAVVMKSDDAGITWYADITGGGTTGGVTSVDGRTGVVTLADLYDSLGAATAAVSAHTAASDPHPQYLTAAEGNAAYDALGAAAAAQAASQPLDSDLTAISLLSTTSYGRGHLTEANAAAGIAYLGLDADLATFSLPASTTITAFGASLVDDANAAAAIATLGLDADISTLSLPASTTISTFGASLIDDTSATAARVTLAADVSLTPTTIQTAATYTANANEFVPVSTTSNAVTVTLPNAPADKTRVMVRLIAQSGTNACTIACAGTDVFTSAGSGVTSLTAAVLGEGFQFIYQSSIGVWHRTSNTVPRSEAWWQATAPAVSANDNFMQVKSSAWISRTPTQAAADLAGPLFGAWTAFTPTVTQGVGISLTSNNSRYFQIGKTVYGMVRFVAGSTGTANSAIRVSMPVTPFASGINPASGTGTIFDTSTNTRMKVWVQNSTAAALFNFFGMENFNNHENGEMGTAAFVYNQMASGDVMTFFFLYEAA